MKTFTTSTMTLYALFVLTFSYPAVTLENVVAAKAMLKPTEGNQVEGSVVFTKQSQAITIQVNIQGLTPGLHAMHIHENGDCSDPQAMSAGGHFNPFSHPHGAPTDMKRHLGDLGNITANEAGQAVAIYEDKHISLIGENNIIGRSVIIHADADDFTTQPTGGAGGRVACGVISAHTN